MSFVDGPSESRMTLKLLSTQRRERIAQTLLTRFAGAFPEIVYELFWASSSMNAQAWRSSKKHVSIYGGLARHPELQWQGLALAIAHETGHHLGGRPRDPESKLLTWQGQADYWAARVAIPKVFGERALKVTLEGARQFLAFHKSIDHLIGNDPDVSASCRYEIFRAGAHGLGIPTCAKIEFEQSFNLLYSEH